MVQKSSQNNHTLNWEIPIGGSDNYQYAMIRKMEIVGISSGLDEHIGEPFSFHIKHCMPLLESNHVGK